LGATDRPADRDGRQGARFKELENLPKDDQDTAIKLIDALIAKGKIKKLVV